MRDIDNYFLQKEEPVKSCLLFLREYILNYDPNITEAWKYNQAPFYCYQEKAFCYLWVHKKNGFPYIGFTAGNRINHPALVSENRVQIKKLMIDPNADMPISTLDAILKLAIDVLINPVNK